MKRSSPIGLLLSLAFALASVQAQTLQGSGDALVRPRTVSPRSPQARDNTAEPRNPDSQTGRSGKVGPETGGTESETDVRRQPVEASGIAKPQVDRAATASNQLTLQSVRLRVAEAERLLKSRPKQTALASPWIKFVTLAALEPVSSRIHLITLPKETFLTKGAEVTPLSSLGTPLSIHIVRANGVNTAVTLLDSAGRALIPLIVEFPIEKGGVFREMAYYTSAHPALLSPELARSGQSYVRTMVELAAKRVRGTGVFVAPQIVDVAERLCMVEHVDHDRFRQENRLALFDEIYSLYALNDLNTYRYSVSLAGAGGMVQMIPWAYNLIRQRHPGVGLVPDFVVGMRNHVNALEAMLLYLQDTWNDLAANEDVQTALSSKIATQTELLAAGYNSNAAHLPLYLRRGGQTWRTLIPRETQIYLQIYKTLDGLIPMKPRPVAVSQTGS